jgi:exodeoxyribonuclease VII large subunit
LAQRLDTAIRDQHRQRLNTLDNIAAALAHLNPEATLARGFSIVRDASGKLVTDAAGLHAGQTISLHLAHGNAEASILATTPDPRPVAT